MQTLPKRIWMSNRNTGKSKGFAFLKAPPHVSDELIKLNGFETQKQSISTSIEKQNMI